MTDIDPSYMMNLVEGKFAGTNRKQLTDLFTAFKNGPNKTLLIHFHGGLIGQQDGIKDAIDLNGQYSAAASCLFPIWETGLFEVLGRDWPSIARDTVFQVVLDRIMSAVHAKAVEVSGVRGLTIDYSPGAFLQADLDESAAGPGDVTPSQLNVDFSALEPLTAFQEKQLEIEFAKDSRLTGEFQAAINAHVGTRDEATRSAFSDPNIKPKQSIVDPAVLDGLVSENEDTRGIPLGVATRILGVVKDVIWRFVVKKDHGLHATATEEILRALYLGAVGRSVWAQMKRYANDAFKKGAKYAGTGLLEEIAALPSGKQVLLIGHSAGAIFISELLIAAAKAGMTTKFDVIFLAPAVRADLFAKALDTAGTLVRNLRIYTMTDENERRDVLVRTDEQGAGLSWFYPRSLLYLISGILEPEVDSPIVGMQRFYAPNVWDAAESPVATVRDYVMSANTYRACWSEYTDDKNSRLAANALAHGDFGRSVMLKGVHNSSVAAIREILTSGVF